MSGLDALTICTVALGAAAAVLVCCTDRVVSVARRLRRRVVTHEPPRPAGRPIEDVARHLRRLRREALAPAPGAPMLRRAAAMAAYEDVLLQAASALGVPDTLSGLRPGTDREAERLRIEHLLRSAGLVLD